MHGNPVGGPLIVEQLQGALMADAAAMTEGSPLCLDVTKVAAGVTGQGHTITAGQAVAAFAAKPSAANARAFHGVTLKAAAAGLPVDGVFWGPCRARVYNASAGSISLGVGDLLQLSPGNDYFVPGHLTAAAGGTSLLVANWMGLPRAIVRKAITLTTLQTALVEVFVFPPSAPRLASFNYSLAGANTTNLTVPLGIAPGPGLIVAAGFGLENCGSAGDVTLDVLINGVSCFTTQPKLVNDGTDGTHTLRATAAAAVGTAGSYGLINAAAAVLAPRDKITATATYSSGTAQAGLNIQVDALLF